MKGDVGHDDAVRHNSNDDNMGHDNGIRHNSSNGDR